MHLRPFPKADVGFSKVRSSAVDVWVMQRIHTTRGHCFQPTPDGYLWEPALSHQCLQRTVSPLAGMPWQSRWLGSRVPSMAEPSMSGSRWPRRTGWGRRLHVVACYSILREIKLPHTPRHKACKAERKAFASLDGSLDPWVIPKSRWQWSVGSRKKLEASKMLSRLVSKEKFYLEMKLAVWLGITYPWKVASRSTWGGSRVPARVRSSLWGCWPRGTAS